jgi:hypothetical protein
MTSNKFVLALVSITLGFMMTGILSAVLLPAVEVAGASLTRDTRNVITTVLMIVLLGTMIGFPIVIFRWLQKRAGVPENDLPESERNPKIAFLGLGILCIGILAYGLTTSTNRVTDLAYLSGQSMALGLLWYVAYSVLLGRHLSGSQKGFSYVAILTSLIVGGYVAAERQSREEAEMLTRVVENVNVLNKPAEGIDGRLEPIQFDSSALQSQNENLVIEAWLNGHLNKLIANQNSYQTELEAIGFFDLLDGERIRARSSLAESAFILERASVIIDKYEELHEESLHTARDNIQTLNISESAKRSVENGFDRTVQSGLDNSRKLWGLERQILTATEKLIVFLDSINPTWEWEGDQFLFSSNKHIEIFDSFIGEIQEAAEQQTLLKELSSKNMDERFQQVIN